MPRPSHLLSVDPMPGINSGLEDAAVLGVVLKAGTRDGGRGFA